MERTGKGKRKKGKVAGKAKWERRRTGLEQSQVAKRKLPEGRRNELLGDAAREWLSLLTTPHGAGEVNKLGPVELVRKPVLGNWTTGI